MKQDTDFGLSSRTVKDAFQHVGYIKFLQRATSTICRTLLSLNVNRKNCQTSPAKQILAISRRQRSYSF